jgi:hypothetical protein
MKLSATQLSAAALIEKVSLRANETKYGATMPDWIDPARTADKGNVAVLQSVLSDVIQNVPFRGTFPELPYYKEALEMLTPVVAESSLYAAYSILRAQAQQLHALRTDIEASADKLHSAAGAAWKLAREPLPRLDEMWLKGPAPMTQAERDAILHPSRYGSTVTPRVQRVKYMRAVRRGRNPQLVRLMAHPRGVEIVDRFNTSAEEGCKFAGEIIEGCLTAIGALQMKLIEPDVIWHFPPAIAAGLRDLGLGERPALAKFFLAWAKKRGTLESALEAAGNATLVLTFAGPVGVALQELVGFVLAAIDTAVSFLNDIEQDQAATATAFADDAQRLSEGSSGLATAVKGATAILAALALPGAVRQLVGRAKAGAKLVPTAKDVARVGARHEADNGRSTIAKGIAAETRKTEAETTTAFTVGARKTEAKSVSSKTIASENSGAEGAGKVSGNGHRGTDGAPTLERARAHRDAQLPPRGVSGPSERMTSMRGIGRPPLTELREEIPVALDGRLLHATDALRRAALNKIKPASNYYDVIVHGDSTSFWVNRNGTWIPVDHRSLATFMRSSGYKGGPVRLISCQAGNPFSVFPVAQNLSNKLGVEVIAPSATLWVHPDGRLSLGKLATDTYGTWESLMPGPRWQLLGAY